jgi:nitroreductase
MNHTTINPTAGHEFGEERVSLLRECLTAAIAAPSVHNTQPWLFRLGANHVDVYADRSRHLPVIDPRSRELAISVGAAVFNLRVAILAHGHLPVQQLLACPDEPDLLARVSLGSRTTPPRTALALSRAIPQRHTNRRPFTDVPVPRDVLAELADAAEAEGAVLVMVDAEVRDAVFSLVREAEGRWREDPAYWQELAQWTMDAPGRPDGVPPAAFGPWSAMELVPLRDFGIIQPGRARCATDFETSHTIAMLYTQGDTTAEWLRAGQALERVLLTATVRGLATTLMTQPLEIPGLRTQLTDPTDGHAPHAIIRFGYGPPGTPSPRRELAQFLIEAGPPGSLR